MSCFPKLIEPAPADGGAGGVAHQSRFSFDSCKLIGIVLTLAWWGQSLLELTGAILLFAKTDFVSVLSSQWDAYVPHLVFLGWTLLALTGWKTLTAGVVLYGSKHAFKFLVTIYLLFMVSWLGPLLSSALSGNAQWYLAVWAVMLVGAVSYLVRYQDVFRALDQLYPHIQPFFDQYRMRIFVRVSFAFFVLMTMWAVWGFAFTWWVVYRRPLINSIAADFLVAWLIWSMYWRSSIVLAGLVRTFNEEVWAWLTNREPETCYYACISTVLWNWPALATSSWLIAYQTVWQMVSLAIPVPLPTNPDKPPLAVGISQLRKLAAPATAAAAAVARDVADAEKKTAVQNMALQPTNRSDLHDVELGTLGESGVDAAGASASGAVPSDDEILQLMRDYRGPDVVGQYMEKSPLTGALWPSIRNPPMQFVHTVLHLEKHACWVSAYKRTLAYFEMNPKLSYFARAHVVTFLTMWFGVAGAATVVAVYQMYFPAANGGGNGIDPLIIIAIQVMAFFAGFLIVSVFIEVFGSGSYVLLYGMTNEMCDLWRKSRPELYQVTRNVINRYWFDQSFG